MSPHKDIRQRLPVIAFIITGLVIAATGFVYLQRTEANRAATFEQTQLELETVKADIEALRTTITPLFAMDSAMRRLESQVMEALAAQGGYIVFEKSSEPPSTEDPIPPRVEPEAVTPTLNVPPEVASAGRKALERIKPLSPAEAIAAIQRDTSSRAVDEIILHHTATPAASYNGVLSIVQLAEIQVYQSWWSQVSWHYAVAPDGSIWLGAPLGTPAIHTPDRQKTTVSVLLIMNGDRELPTDAQRDAVGVVLRALLDRYRIAPEVNFTSGRGLHREHTRNQNCPGSRITHELVRSWIAAVSDF